MSKRKRRNAEDRQLILENLKGNPIDVIHALGLRRCRVNRGQWRVLAGMSAYYGVDSLGRSPWRLRQEIYRQLEKRGFIRTVNPGPRNDRGYRNVPYRKKPGRTARYTLVVDPPPRPGRAKNERRGQSKPGQRR